LKGVLWSLSPEVGHIKFSLSFHIRVTTFGVVGLVIFTFECVWTSVVLCTRIALTGVIACTEFLDGNISARCSRRRLRRKSFVWCLSSSYRYCKIFGLPTKMNHTNGRAHCELKAFVPVQSTVNGGELLALHISFVIRGGSST